MPATRQWRLKLAKAAQNARHQIVSSESEELILVDENDNEIGHDSKALCHDGGGILHRAFSLFIFNEAGELLLQQRSSKKRLWPLYWSNSCCSHPRRGETMDEAVRRRLDQELGLKSDLKFLYKFKYHAQYEDVGSEREFCWVYAGKSDDPVRVNGNEVAAWRFVKPGELSNEMNLRPEAFTPWFKMEWDRITNEYGHVLSML